MLEKIKRFFISFFTLIWVTLVVMIMAAPLNAGGAEINGFLALILWIVCVWLIVKKHPIISCVLSTTLAVAIRVSKFGVGDFSGFSEEITLMLGWIFLGFIFYKMFFGRYINDPKEKGESRQRTKRQRPSYSDGYDSYYSDSRHIENEGPKLISGSNEYWEYREAAEGIYWDFCEARTTDARRHHKSRGDKLKTHLISEYGSKDECVRSIIDQFLDLRV